MFLSSSWFYHPHIYKSYWKYCAASQIISKAFPHQAGWTSRSESTNIINGSLLPIQFSPNSKIKYFSFSIARGQLWFSADFRLFNAGRSLLVPKLHTFNSNFNSNYCLYKSVESFLVEESAYISIAVTLFMIKRDAFFSAVPPLCWPRRDWLDWPAETFNRYNCVWVCSSQPSSILWLRSSIFPCLSICLTVPPSRIGDLTSYVHY